MSLKNSLKHLVFKLPENWIHHFYSIYNYCKFPDLRERRIDGGDANPDSTVYIIRPRPGNVEGLMALYMDVVKQLSYAEKHGYIPVVDFQNYKTQYRDLSQKTTKNVWEYYFAPVSLYSVDEAYCCKNIILSGLNAIENCDEWLRQKYDEASLKKTRALVRKYIHINSDIKKFVELEKSKIQFSPDTTLGLYLRGTDYIKLKPAGHPVQPSAEQAIEVADQFLEKYHLSKVFLVTEDQEMYAAVKKHFAEKLTTVSFDSFISGYNGKDFLSNNDDDINQLAASQYERGLKYLCKEILLSECKYFVGGNTSGSWAAHTLSNGYVDEYIFDLGKY